jgi:hypothetical protein
MRFRAHHPLMRISRRSRSAHGEGFIGLARTLCPYRTMWCRTMAMNTVALHRVGDRSATYQCEHPTHLVQTSVESAVVKVLQAIAAALHDLIREALAATTAVARHISTREAPGAVAAVVHHFRIHEVAQAVMAAEDHFTQAREEEDHPHIPVAAEAASHIHQEEAEAAACRQAVAAADHHHTHWEDLEAAAYHQAEAAAAHHQEAVEEAVHHHPIQETCQVHSDPSCPNSSMPNRM